LPGDADGFWLKDAQSFCVDAANRARPNWVNIDAIDFELQVATEFQLKGGPNKRWTDRRTYRATLRACLLFTFVENVMIYDLVGADYHMCKNVRIKIKDVKKTKNVTKIKKTFVNVIKNVTCS